MLKEDPLVKNFADKNTPLSNLPLTDVRNLRLNIPFRDFRIDDWDPEQEEKL